MISRLLPDGYVTMEDEPLAPERPSSELSFESLERICRANAVLSSCRVVADSQKLFRRRGTLTGAPSFLSGRRQSDGETAAWSRSGGRRESSASSMHQSVESRESEAKEPAEFAPPEMKRSGSQREERPVLTRLGSSMMMGGLDRRQNQSFYKVGLSSLFTVATSNGYLAELREMLFEGSGEGGERRVEGDELPLTLRPVVDGRKSGEEGLRRRF